MRLGCSARLGSSIWGPPPLQSAEVRLEKDPCSRGYWQGSFLMSCWRQRVSVSSWTLTRPEVALSCLLPGPSQCDPQRQQVREMGAGLCKVIPFHYLRLILLVTEKRVRNAVLGCKGAISKMTE